MSQERRNSDLTQLRDVLLDRGQVGSEAPPELRSAPRFGSLPPKALLVRKNAGEVGESEEAAIRGVAKTLNSHLEDEHLTLLLRRFDESLSQQGLEERLSEVTTSIAVDKVSAESAYTLAAAVAVANGTVSAQEQDLLREVAALLGISPRRALELSGQPR
jgi:tellurite resistance protein